MYLLYFVRIKYHEFVNNIETSIFSHANLII